MHSPEHGKSFHGLEWNMVFYTMESLIFYSFLVAVEDQGLFNLSSISGARMRCDR